MILFGKYAFDRLRDTFQGIFEFQVLNGEAPGTVVYLLELWQIRFVIRPNESLELYLNSNKDQRYIKLGKIKFE